MTGVQTCALPISLFSILGTTYGGDGRTTFGLPDLRGRVAIHPGTGPGLTPYRLGEKGGVEANQLSESQIGDHTHAQSISENATWKTKRSKNANDTVAPVIGQVNTATRTGSVAPVNNLQPFQAVNYVICLVGTFPSRN